MVDELVVKDVINVWTLGGVVVKNLSDNIPCCIGNGYIFWEGISVHPNALVGSFDITSFEGRFSDYQGVNYYSQ